jgi:hypothetical protein
MPTPPLVLAYGNDIYTMSMPKRNDPRLKQLRISTILGVHEVSAKPRLPKGSHYSFIPIHEKGPLWQRRPFLRAARLWKRQRRLIIHCKAGRSRSVTLAVALSLALGRKESELPARAVEKYHYCLDQKRIPIGIIAQMQRILA